MSITSIEFNANSKNPYIRNPNANYGIQMGFDFEYAKADAEEFKNTIKNAVSQFRASVCYKGYKNFLMSLGLNHCQVYGNINSDMAEIEMHHNGLTIFDIAVMIAYHIMSVYGVVDSFDIFKGLRYAHSQSEVPLVFLSETPHQLYHGTGNLCLPMSMCVGNWLKLLSDFRFGISYGIAKKLYAFIDNSLNTNLETYEQNLSLLQLRDTIKDWSDYNEFGGFIEVDDYTSCNTSNYLEDMQYNY